MSDEDPSALIDAKIASLGDWRSATLAKLRALIREADPDVVENFGGTTSVNNDIRRRVWVAHIPADGNYRIAADGKVQSVTPVVGIEGVDRCVVETLKTWQFPKLPVLLCKLQTLRFEIP